MNPNARAVDSITSEISHKTGSLTEGDQVVFYLFSVPKGQSMVYRLESSRADTYARFCEYDAATGTVYLTDAYQLAGKAGAVNNLPAGQYVMMVTYTNGYTADANFTLHTNSSVIYQSGMSYVTFSTDLGAVITKVNSRVYSNSNYVYSTSERSGIPNAKLYYLSQSLPNYSGVSFSAQLLNEYADEYDTPFYGIEIKGTSGVGRYISEKYDIQHAMLLYLTPNNMAEIREYMGSTRLNYDYIPLRKAKSTPFIVYDCDQDRYVEFYLNVDNIPKDGQLLYLFL